MKPAAFLLAALLLSARAGAEPGVTFHQEQMDGWRSRGLDVSDRMAVLAALWAKLPAEVQVYPSENYYYWQLHTGGRELRGNLRLATGQREQGLLHFGYTEWQEFPDPSSQPPLTVTGHFGKDEGVLVTCPDHFTSHVTFRGKTVCFLLNRTGQEAPRDWKPGPDETFIQRTMDESGLPFFLLFNTRQNYFFWVLNEEGEPVETFTPLAHGAVAGRRTGFLFWQQDSRKVLLGVRKLSVERNDYCDGPFDQLADNYAVETKIREWIERAYPEQKGRIDLYGYITDTPGPKRIALNCYLHYDTPQQALELLATARRQPDPLMHISSGGK